MFDDKCRPTLPCHGLYRCVCGLYQDDTPFSGGCFNLEIEFPAEYPFKAPKVWSMCPAAGTSDCATEFSDDDEFAVLVLFIFIFVLLARLRR